MRVKIFGPKEGTLVEREMASFFGRTQYWPEDTQVYVTAADQGRITVVVIYCEDDFPETRQSPSSPPPPRQRPSGEVPLAQDVEGERTMECPLCGEVMVQRRGPSGVAFWGCPHFPDCPGTRCDTERETVADKECPLCFGVMIRRSNRTTGEAFWGCSGFPHCRGMRKGLEAAPVVGKTEYKGQRMEAEKERESQPPVECPVAEDANGNIPF